MLKRHLSLLCSLSFGLIACQAEILPPLVPPIVGSVVGEAFIENPQRESVGGVVVEIRGVSAKATSVAGKQFVLSGIPKGEHVVNLFDPQRNLSRQTSVEVDSSFQTIFLDADATTLRQSARIIGTVTVAEGDASGTRIYLAGGSSSQLTFSGSDGGYSLDGLPAGTQRIAFSRPGFATLSVEINLDEGENSLEAVALQTSSIQNLSLAGTALANAQVDHRGTAVLLNGGEQVVATDENGNFNFAGLAPGAYSLRAERPGYRSAELPNISIDNAGTVYGLTPLFLAEGTDDASLAELGGTFEVSINNPPSGTVAEVGEMLSLLAGVTIDGEVIPASSIAWSYQDVAQLGASVSLGSGNPLNTDVIPIGSWLLSATASSSSGAQALGQSVLEVLPLQIAVQITSHDSNDAIVSSLPLILAADASARPGVEILDSNIEWSFRSALDEEFKPLGTGASLLSNFAAVAGQTLIDIQATVTLAGGQSSDIISVFLNPFFPLAVVPQGIAAPAPVIVDDGMGGVLRTEYSIAAGQPVTLRVDLPPGSEDLADSIVWDASGYLFLGAQADLSVLPPATYDFDVSLGVGGGSSTTIRVIVEPFVFDVDIVQPEPTSTYFVSSGLPLEVQILHPYQSSFPVGDIRWVSSADGLIATGPVARSFLLNAGTGTVSVEVEDLLGNGPTDTSGFPVLPPSVSYNLAQVDFTVSFIQPGPSAPSVLEGVSVPMSVSVFHSLVNAGELDESALRIRYSSNIQGLLSNDLGTFDFAHDETAHFNNLQPGIHTITAEARDGSRTTQVLTEFSVRSPGVNATLLSPADGLVVFDGEPLVFEVSTTADGAVTPIYEWFIDPGSGATEEFGLNWGGYGDPGSAVDDMNQALRERLDFGNYSTASSPFEQVQWDAGEKFIEFRMRLPSVDSGLGCVNIPSEAVCLRFSVIIAPDSGVDVCPSTTNTLTSITTNQTWDTVKRLNCPIQITSGAQVTIVEGTRILIDDSVSQANRYIRLANGSLTIGSPTAVDRPVIFEAINNKTADDRWYGLELAPSNDTTVATLTMDHVILRNTNDGIDADEGRWTSASNHEAHLNNVTFESTTVGWRDFCPNTAQNISFRQVSLAAILEHGSGGNCGSNRVYDGGYVFESVQDGFRLDRSGSIEIANVEASEIQGAFAYFVSAATFGTQLNIHDNVIEGGVGVNGIIRAEAQCERVRLYNNIFRDNEKVLRLDGCDAEPGYIQPRYEVVGNIFDNNAVGIEDRDFNPRAGEVHLNAFYGTGTYIDVPADGTDISAQGNFGGSAGDFSTPGGIMLAADAGELSNLPRLRDFWDITSNEKIVRWDNPLHDDPQTLLGIPSAYVREPKQTEVYRSTCLPLEAASPVAGVDTLSDCRWYLDGDSVSGTQVFPDGDGCLGAQELLSDGEHSLQLDCDLVIDGMLQRTDSHSVRFLIDDSRYSGIIRRTNESWSGTVSVDGDIVIPAGRTLTLEPGTTVLISDSDQRFYEFYPRWAVPSPSPNINFGARTKVDFFVEGTLNLGGQAGSRIVMRDEGGSPNPSQWGGIRVMRGGEVLGAHTDVMNATYSFHGEVDPLDIFSAPDIQLDNVRIENQSQGMRGVCPSVFQNSEIRSTSQVFYRTFCYGDLLLDNSVFEDAGDNSGTSTAMIWLDVYTPSTPLGDRDVTLNNIDFMRGGDGARKTIALYTQTSGISSISVNGGSFQHFHEVFRMATSSGAESLVVQNTSFDNISSVMGESSQLDNLSFDQSTFSNSARILNGSSRDAVSVNFSNNRVENVDTPFYDITFGSSVTGLVVADNLFDGGDVVFENFRVNSTSDASYPGSGIYDMGGNNFMGYTQVLDLTDTYLDGCASDRNANLRMDFSGNYYEDTLGAAVTTDAEIRTLLNEPDTPCAGRQINWPGYALAPNALPLVP